MNLKRANHNQAIEATLRTPPADNCCVIDWANFTVSEDTWVRTGREQYIACEDFVREASRKLEKIFGFGVTKHRKKGMNFYTDSWLLGDDFGFVCFGGQRRTMLITLNGLGCANALKGWELRLYKFLNEDAIRPTITRIDLAHDDLLGKAVSVNWAENQWEIGGFTPQNGGNPPNIERRGNWHRPTGEGRTLTIGKRTNGKFCRIYEKGKMEGSAESLWTRAEVELKNKDRVLPLDILLRPSDYFTACYPCFSDFDCNAPERIAVKQKTAEITIDKSVRVIQHQFGKYFNVLVALHEPAELVELVRHPNKEGFPQRLKPVLAMTRSGGKEIHKRPKRTCFDPLVVTEEDWKKDNFEISSNYQLCHTLQHYEPNSESCFPL